jgi:O-succinylbenzoate synthase
MEPYGTPEQYRQQQELEEARRWSSLQALALFASRIKPDERDHLAHLCWECGVSESEVNYYATKKEAA